MSSASRCKYIAIGFNVFVILFSLSVLVGLYLFASTLSNGPEKWDGEEESVKRRLYGLLPSLLQNLVDWLGRSVVSSQEANTAGGGGETSSLFTAGRPLIAASFLYYLLSIVVLIAVGLEHFTLLIILIAIFAFLFSVSLTALVYTFLSTILEQQEIFPDFWNSLLAAVIGISGLEFYITAYLFYLVYMERRSERSNEYSLAKMVTNINDL